MTGEPVQRDHPQRGAVNATTTATTTDGATVTRQCARCRLHFPVEAGTHPMELPSGWWVCPTCADALLPSRRRRSNPPGERPGGST